MLPQDSIMLEKARQYCDYSERCVQDVREKLMQWQLRPEIIDKIILQLDKEDYINEDRYVRAFALGKLRNNKWGRNKILYALRQKNIPELLLQIGLEELETNEYTEIAKKLLQEKKISESDPFKRRNKLANFAIQKGFQSSLVWKLINEMKL